jgi:hypothetical protein
MWFVYVVGYHHVDVCDCLGLLRKDMVMERRGEKVQLFRIDHK